MCQVDLNLFVLAFQACPEPLVLLDAGGRPAAVSAGAIRRLGVGLETLQDHWPDVCVRRQNGFQDCEGVCHCAHDIPGCGAVEITCVSLKDVRGGAVGGLAEIQRRRAETDVTEEDMPATGRASETPGSQMRKIRADALMRLAGGIAHNFNNALAGVIGVASLARLNHGDDPELVHDLDDIIGQARRMAKWTRDLLAYAREGAFSPTVCDLNETIENALNVIRPSTSRAFQILFEGCDDLPPVKVDVSQIQELCEQIVNNASEACGGRGTLRIRTERGAEESQCSPSDDREWVRIIFQDDGPGMEETTVKQIFDPFFSTRFAGRGMGLAVARSIAEWHGGRIAVRSELGAGTRFDVWLPGVPGAEAEKNGAEANVSVTQAAEQGRGDLPQSTPHIGPVLVVDDEPVVASMVQQFLQREGIEVVVANSGEEAVRKADEFGARIRLVLMDVVLPDLSGLDLLNHLRQHGIDAPVLICSAYDESNPAVQSLLDHGAEALVQKPFDAGKLAARVRRRLSSRA